MGLKKAGEYIRELHELQDNPFQWPDFLTGLPDRAAVLRKISDVFEKRGKYTVTLVKISNIQSYIIKYGYSRHSEIIQWASAILKTTSEKYRGSFVGVLGTHEFVIISRAEHMEAVLKEARQLFQKKARSFYSPADLKKKYLFSYQMDGKKVIVGFMDLIHATLKNYKGIDKREIIPTLTRSVLTHGNI